MLPWGRTIAAALCAAVLVGCSSAPRVPPKPTAAPLPSPQGAIYGRVLHPDGTPVRHASVSLFQFDRSDEVRAVSAILSLGFFCFIPTDAFCPKAVGTRADEDGSYSFKPKDMKKASTMAVTASVEGAETTVDLPDGPDPQRIPDIVLWDPKLSTTTVGRNLRVSWTPLSGVPLGASVTYDEHVVDERDITARPNKVGGPATAASASIDTRLFEDTRMSFYVTAHTSTAKGVNLTYAWGGTKLPPGPVAPSRGRPCLADDKNGALKRTAGVCGMTDKDLWEQLEVLLPGECSVDAKTPCSPQAVHKKLCVDLGGSRTVSYIVVRSPFLDGLQVELSADGRSFRPLGPRYEYTTDERPKFFVRTVNPPANASMVCVTREPWQFNGHILSEVSVW